MFKKPETPIFALCVINPNDKDTFVIVAYCYLFDLSVDRDNINFSFLRFAIIADQKTGTPVLEQPAPAIKLSLSVAEFTGTKEFRIPEASQHLFRIIWIHPPKVEKPMIVVPSLSRPVVRP